MLRFLAAFAVLIVVGPAVAASTPTLSGLTRIEVTSEVADGIYGGVQYERIGGTAHGQIDPKEAVVGLATLPKNTAGAYEYASNFELIVPVAGQAQNQALYIDSENRGSAISKSALNGFLQNHATSYARIQWQTAISAGVPDKAQGVGLVIMRDFARWLAGRTSSVTVSGAYQPTGYSKLILGGISQSAWFVNTFIAEGFNADPVTGNRVFDAAIAVDGTGNWLAINNIAAARGVTKQTPYVDPNGKPLSRDELMSRPHTDPLYIDIANYTDFYRLRAGLTSSPRTDRNFRRYDFPSMHVASRAMSSVRCNGGVPVQQNPLGYAPYMRALVLGMEKQIGVDAARHAKGLPNSAAFKLAKDQPAASANFNPLPGTFTPVPKVDVNGMPMGGVRFPESRFPLGRPEPVSLAPAITTSISETCGNSGGFKPFGRAALDAKYGSMEIWLAHYDAMIDDRVKDGFLLEEDRAGMLDAAAQLYALWP